jgi:outer membrane protein assembly factor BamA
VKTPSPSYILVRQGIPTTLALLWLLAVAAPPAPAQGRILPRIDSRAPKVEEARAPGVPSDAELQAAGARIGEVRIVLQDIFDTENPEENTAIGRLANELHIETREATIRDQLLFRPGDAYVGRVIEESARLLRGTRYLRDAQIRPVAYREGVVDLEVVGRDVWTLNPGVSFGRKGGKSTTGVELEELNLLGLGVEVSLDVISGVDRDTTAVEFADRQLGGSWWGLDVLYADNSDGRLVSANLAHPFYALDTRWAAGVAFTDNEATESRYDLGAIVDQYRVLQRSGSAYFGRSAGLRAGWAMRYTFSLNFDERNFVALAAPNNPTRLLPEDRRLFYPAVGVEWVQDDFRTERNRDQIEKIEDFALGWRAFVQAGFAVEGSGSDRDAGIFRAGVAKGFDNGARQTLLLNAYTGGRVESGDVRGAVSGLSTRYYFRESRRRTVFLGLSADFAERLDADQQLLLGGDNGLRGYPLRYQAGTARWLFTAEQRFYTSWYPFRLVNVGGAVFYDMGRVTGRDSLGTPSRGLLRDVGFGLRFGNARSGLGNVLHVDVAFPLDGDASIDDVQFLVETKRSY